VAQVLQERRDELGVEVVQAQLAGGCAGAVVREGQQQPEGVPVGGDGVAAGLQLGDQPLGEEALEHGGKRGHRVPRGMDSRRPAASASSSGVTELVKRAGPA
jgi:hypothetical protein